MLDMNIDEPISKIKCYVFEFNAFAKGKGCVYAKDEEDAKEKIYNNDYEELEIVNTQVEDIVVISEN